MSLMTMFLEGEFDVPRHVIGFQVVIRRNASDWVGSMLLSHDT